MLAGHVEVYDQLGIGGWAIDDEQPGVPQLVDILFDGHFYARVTASLPKRGRGECGFKLLLPREVGIRRERVLVEVRFAANQALLGNSPAISPSAGRPSGFWSWCRPDCAMDTTRSKRGLPRFVSTSGRITIPATGWCSIPP